MALALSICSLLAQAIAFHVVPLEKKYDTAAPSQLQSLLLGQSLEELQVSSVGTSDYWRTQLQNSLNSAYLGPVFLGTPYQGSLYSKFFFDTSSTYTTVTSTSCSNCNTTFFNANASNSYQEVGGGPSEMSYIEPKWSC